MSILYRALFGSDCSRHWPRFTRSIAGVAVLGLPLFHLHTFIALTIVLVCFLVAGDPQIRGHILTLVLSALIPATFFVWLVTDHFDAGSVLEFHPGWAQHDGEFKMSFFRFWFFNF